VHHSQIPTLHSPFSITFWVTRTKTSVNQTKQLPVFTPEIIDMCIAAVYREKMAHRRCIPMQVFVTNSQVNVISSLPDALSYLRDHLPLSMGIVILFTSSQASENLYCSHSLTPSSPTHVHTFKSARNEPPSCRHGLRVGARLREVGASRPHPMARLRCLSGPSASETTVRFRGVAQIALRWLAVHPQRPFAYG
jgi:hypothetical protein